ncbi:hypothetical protein ACFYNY_20235 [Streptomyces sp. NPDC006530]|uniref:hypothetical protein n=1 Tax=Streptomyces sp. NPDC006530 TaxID=3364750 RepID=UPI0036D1A8C6
MDKVRRHLMLPLDGFTVAPGHSMDWMPGVRVSPGVVKDRSPTLRPSWAAVAV